MKVFNELIFDESIKDTGNTWYTPGEYDDLLGTVDIIDFMIQVSNVGGSTPMLTVAIEDSADGRHWREIAKIANNLLIETTKLQRGAAAFGVLSFVRLRTTLGGTNPECRLKLYATGRAI